MIDFLIDYHEAVVSFLIVMECDSGILGIVSRNILMELARNLAIVNIN